MEWLVAQEIWQQSILGWSSTPKAIGCWASKEYEIDFVTPDKDLIEVKRGKASPIDFGFPHPGRLVCCRAPGDCAPFDNGLAPTHMICGCMLRNYTGL
jgi:hypothetical protein